MTKSVNDLYLDIKNIFLKNDIPSPALCAREICAYSLGLSKNDITSWAYRYVFDEDIKKTTALAQRHLDGEPIAYIISEWDFYSHTFIVTPDVLIPRPDTESVVEYAILKLQEFEKPKVLDLCCGTGCIGIILAKHVENCKVLSVDVSDKAVEIAQKNSQNASLGARHVVTSGDVLQEDTTRFGKFSMIIANPPYIPTNDIYTLDKSVKDYEPHLALDGGTDGYKFYRAICKNFKDNLLDDGLLIFECGINQHEDIAEIMFDAGYIDINTVQDLTGTQRIVCGRYMPL